MTKYTLILGALLLLGCSKKEERRRIDSEHMCKMQMLSLLTNVVKDYNDVHHTANDSLRNLMIGVFLKHSKAIQNDEYSFDKESLDELNREAAEWMKMSEIVNPN